MSVISVDPNIVRKIGANAALVYGQICYWLTKAQGGHSRYTVDRDGHKWAARSREQIGEETGLSDKQVKTAIKVLKDHALIQTQQWKFDEVPICHFARAQMGPQETDTKAHMGPPTKAQMGPPFYTETYSKIKESKIGDEVATLSGEKEVVSKKKGSVSVADVLAGTRVSKQAEPVPLSKVSKPGQLEKVFRDAWVETYPDIFLPSFTLKQMGQLKQIIAKYPPGKAGPVVDHCVKNWSSFSHGATHDQGAIKIPDMPDVAALLRFAQSAVACYVTDNAPTEASTGPKLIKTPSHPTTATKSAPKASQPIPDEDKPMTLEELHKKMGIA